MPASERSSRGERTSVAAFTALNELEGLLDSERPMVMYEVRIVGLDPRKFFRRRSGGRMHLLPTLRPGESPSFSHRTWPGGAEPRLDFGE